ncbi:Poly [ADP-ribose] polymerase 2, partial [Perkinsus olseni]
MFIGDSTVEEVYKFWGASGLTDLFGARDLIVEFKSVWGTFDRMYSDARNPFLCDEKVMALNGWRRVEDVADSVEQLNPSVIILGENLHTLKKVGVSHYEVILDRLLSVVTASCPDCLVLLLPTKQPVGRLCPCGKATGISSCAYDIFYSRKRLRRANEVAMEVAERYGVKVLWDVYEMTLARQELSRDGIHWGTSFFLCEDGWCPEVSCKDYEQGNWRPFPEGYAVTNRSPEGMAVIKTQRNNFLADLYYPSVMAITSEMILDKIEELVLHRVMSRSILSSVIIIILMLPSGPIINNNRPHRHPAGFTTLSPHAAAFVPSSALWQHHPPAAAAAAPPPFSLPSACPTTSSNAAISHYSRPDWNSYRQPASSSVASPSPSSPAVSCSTLGGCSNSSLTGEIYQPSRHQADTSPHQKCSCKLLVTHKQAGAIIGKSGSEISQIEQAAKVSIKVSPSGCFFPGTQERVLVIFGESMNIREALQDITSKFEYCNEILQVQEETKSPYFRDWDEGCTGVGCRARPLVMRLVVPNSAVGVLMGQHGSEIKNLAVGCGVHI